MEKKTCTRCKKALSTKLFYESQQRGDVNGQVWRGRDSMCMPCRSDYCTERRRAIKLQAIEYLGGRCVGCGLEDVPEVYDFHHVDPSKKDFSLGANTKAFETIKKELDKCILLCANCHRKEHVKLQKKQRS